MQRQFNKLKELLTTAPILKIEIPDKDFVVCIDACNEGLGGVLTQEDHAIAYESRKLKNHKKELCNLWLRVGCNNPCFKNVAPSLNR